MAIIQEIQLYKLDGKEFKSLQKVKSYVQDKIGDEFIKGFNFHYKQKIAFLEYLTKKENRDFLNEYLNIKFKYHDCETNAMHENKTANILDL